MANNTPNTWPAVDRTQAYASQIACVLEAIQAFLPKNTKKLALPLVPEKFTLGLFEWTPNYVMTEFTRSQVKAAMKAAMDNVREHGKPVAVRNLPTNPSAALELTYTVSKGKNAGTKRFLLAHGMGVYRGAMRFAASEGVLNVALKAGEAWFCKGVNDKDGNPRAFISKKKARSAYCQMTWGKDWYKTDKDARNDEAYARITQGKPAITMDQLSSMAAVKVTALARKAGASNKITTGKGAKARSIDWFSKDVARLNSVSQ